MVDIGKMTSGLVVVLVSVFVGYIIFNSLFTPTNTALVAVNTSIASAGHTNEAVILTQSWKLYLMAIPLALMAGAIAYMVGAFKKGG